MAQALATFAPIPWRVARPNEVTIEEAPGEACTHVVKLADGREIKLNVGIHELARAGEDDPVWERIKLDLVDAGVAVAVLVGVLCALRVVALTFGGH